MIEYNITWKYTVYDPGAHIFHWKVWADNRTQAVKQLRYKVVGPIDVLRIKEI